MTDCLQLNALGRFAEFKSKRVWLITVRIGRICNISWCPYRTDHTALTGPTNRCLTGHI